MDLNKKYRELLKKEKAYTYALQILNWDSQTEAPRDCFPQRAEVMGFLSGEMFKISTGKDMQEAVYGLYEQKDTLDEITKREIHKAKKQLDRITKIPENEFIEYNRLLQMAQRIWEDAKANNDYQSFKGTLAEIIEYTKKFVSYYGEGKHPYDVLLDQYEEGMSMKEYDEFFATLKRDLVPFVRKVLAVRDDTNYDFLSRKYDIDTQKKFSNYLMDVMHFNRNRGLLKQSVHPFTWGTSPEDVRLTTKYVENMVFSNVFSVIHELGHATYEQQIDSKWNNTFLEGGTSMGIHESQSRFYENIIGRSHEFWETHYPKLKSLFPEQLKDVDVDLVHRGVNRVEASLIRTEADELTYPLHIMVRYEIERMIMNGEIGVDDLPEVWNEKMEEYLGVTPDTDTEGVLQDVHWSSGMIGYFPTYALGSAYSAQFYNAMQKDFDVLGVVKTNDMGKINAWLKEKIHQYGSSKDPKELLLDVTGEAFNPKYYIEYLKDKYSKIYF